MRGQFFALLTVLLFSAPAVHAATVSGAGGKTCKDFLQGVELNSKEAINSYISWAQGFISGFNWSNVKGADVQIDPAGLQYSLTQTCTAKPELGFFQAVQSVIAANAR